MASVHAEASRLANAIESELTRLGRWSSERPPDEAFVDMSAFGMNTLTPEQWLQFVLVPRVREVVHDNGSFPESSSVSVWATRNFDGDPEADALLALLRDFDALFDGDAAARDATPDSDDDGPPSPDTKLTRLTARLVLRLAQLPGVKSAYLAQLYFPSTEQLTTPVLGLDLDGPFAVDALASFPKDDPFVAMALADDAISRLLRLGAPFYTRDT